MKINIKLSELAKDIDFHPKCVTELDNEILEEILDIKEMYIELTHKLQKVIDDKKYRKESSYLKIANNCENIREFILMHFIESMSKEELKKYRSLIDDCMEWQLNIEKKENEK